MTDLLKWLRVVSHYMPECGEAADRIDELGAANDKLSCDALQLYNRIEKLETALRRLIDYGMVSHQDLERAQKALEGKDG